MIFSDINKLFVKKKRLPKLFRQPLSLSYERKTYFLMIRFTSLPEAVVTSTK